MAFWIVMIAETLDGHTSSFGAALTSCAVFDVDAVVTLLASIPAIVLLVRPNSRRSATTSP
jgi:hypothetical protein